jgi:hypothetical protein
LRLYHMLWVPPFNLFCISRLTRSLKCVISFTKDFFFLQDQILGWMTFNESSGFSQLSNHHHIFPTIGRFPLLIHAQLGHPNLAISPSYPLYLLSFVNMGNIHVFVFSESIVKLYLLFPWSILLSRVLVALSYLCNSNILFHPLNILKIGRWA